MKKISLVAVAASALLLSAIAPSMRAELIVGLTTDNRITFFDSASPGLASAPILITGLGANQTLVGIDRRPNLGANNGLLYGLALNGTMGQVYTINEVTGFATLVSTLNVAVNGNNFGIDFNPVPDRLRIVSDLDQNLRANVDNGVTAVDMPLNYAPADPNAGQNPNIVAAAYSNNFGGATTTVLRDVDSDRDVLATQTPPNNGTLNTVLPIGFNITAVAGYDISGLSGTPYFSFILDGQAFSGFYTISGGMFTLIGNVSLVTGGPLALRDIAAPVGVPIPEGGAGLLGLFTLATVTLAGARLARKTSLQN